MAVNGDSPRLLIDSLTEEIAAEDDSNCSSDMPVSMSLSSNGAVSISGSWST